MSKASSLPEFLDVIPFWEERFRRKQKDPTFLSPSTRSQVAQAVDHARADWAPKASLAFASLAGFGAARAQAARAQAARRAASRRREACLGGVLAAAPQAELERFPFTWACPFFLLFFFWGGFPVNWWCSVWCPFQATKKRGQPPKIRHAHVPFRSKWPKGLQTPAAEG